MGPPSTCLVGLVLAFCSVHITFPIMASVSDFYAAPSKSFLESCQKKFLLQIAKHYGVKVIGNRRKDEMRDVVITALRCPGRGRAPVGVTS